METLQNMIIALVREAPTEALDRLQQELLEGATDVAPSGGIPGYLLQPTLRAWKAVGLDILPPKALALAIATARAMKQRVEENIPQLDLVWTGPHSPANIRTETTAAVLRTMIESARLRILIVSYDLTRYNEPALGVIDALARARARGIKVTMALHDDSSNFKHVLDLWPRELPLPRLLRWIGVPGDHMAKLHAKLAVVDSRDLLITSANLTFHGLEQNIEMGVRIRGQFAADVDRHFANLEAEGILVPIGEARR